MGGEATWFWRMSGKTVFERRDGRRRSSVCTTSRSWREGLVPVRCLAQTVGRGCAINCRCWKSLASSPWPTRARIASASPATIDRLLCTCVHGRSYTKPTTRLTNEIPVRTFTEWPDTRERSPLISSVTMHHQRRARLHPGALRPPDTVVEPCSTRRRKWSSRFLLIRAWMPMPWAACTPTAAASTPQSPSAPLVPAAALPFHPFCESSSNCGRGCNLRQVPPFPSCETRLRSIIHHRRPWLLVSLRDHRIPCRTRRLRGMTDALRWRKSAPMNGDMLDLLLARLGAGATSARFRAWAPSSTSERSVQVTSVSLVGRPAAAHPRRSTGDSPSTVWPPSWISWRSAVSIFFCST